MDEKMRLDVYVAKKLSDKPRTYARRLIDEGNVLVNTELLKASYLVKESDKIQINEPALETTGSINIEIIYEDKDCVVIDKPEGVLSHSKGPLNLEPTVATWLAERLNHNPSNNRFGIVHRLDRATSGVMICAKNELTSSWLQKQFSSRKVKKSYLAVVNNTIRPSEAIIDIPIARNPKMPQKFMASSSGKNAITEYKVLSEFTKNDKRFSLVELRPTTGRTHQLRVHLEHLGHPIVGDKFYGGEKNDRLLLHANKLEITLPSRKRKVFEATPPRGIAEFCI